jgi:toxin FitB
MIILDTNAVTEPRKPLPNLGYMEWLRKQTPGTLFTTTVTVAEMLLGIETLPTGKRKEMIRRGVVDMALPLFDDRILEFGQNDAVEFAKIVAKARRAGNDIEFADAVIAAIAARRGLSLVTRNVKDFKGTGVQIVMPWSV